MAVLYGQITTHQPVLVTSSTGQEKIYSFKLMIDIQRNKPIILDRKVMINKDGWRGTIIEFTLEGDYLRAMTKIIEYFKQTAMVNHTLTSHLLTPKVGSTSSYGQLQLCRSRQKKLCHTLTA